MKSNSGNRHMTDFLFTVVLLFVFAAAAIGVTLCATRIYGSIVDNSARNDSARTAAAYISEKIHMNDAGGDVFVGSVGSHEAFILTTDINSRKYRSYFFVADGQLREIFASADFENTVENGTPITELEALEIRKLSDSLYSFTCTGTDGRTVTTTVALRSKG